MKLEVVSSLVSFIGKPSELPNIKEALNRMAEELNYQSPAYFDNSDDDAIDLGFAYDQDDYRVEEIKAVWRRIK